MEMTSDAYATEVLARFRNHPDFKKLCADLTSTLGQPDVSVNAGAMVKAQARVTYAMGIPPEKAVEMIIRSAFMALTDYQQLLTNRFFTGDETQH